jgi:hypothetical protein
MIRRDIVLVFALALLYGAAWLGAAFWLRMKAEDFAADLVSQGYVIEHGEPLLVGFPTTVGVAVPGLSITAPPAHGAWRWQADRVRVSLYPGAPKEPVVDLAGRHRVAGFLSAPEEGLSVTVGRGVASLAFAEDQTLDNIVLKLSETTVAGARDETALLALKDSSLHVSLARGHVTLWVREIALPHPIPVLGESISALDLTLDFTGALPSGPLRESLEAWRAGGGAVEVRSLTLDWPPAAAAGTATIALDEALQPMGAATLKFRGFFDIVAALTEKGYVHEREASMAKIVLGMLARASPSGEPELSLPLTVQNRKLSAGPVMLMEVPEVVWDEGARVP